MAKALKEAHGRSATYWNAAHASSGHAWQGRILLLSLGYGASVEALRYAELNPVRAGLVAHAQEWKWSSAAAHCGTTEPDELLEMEPWRENWSMASWRDFLSAGETESELAAIRQCTHTGRPLGTKEFVKELEEMTRRQLAPRKGGRRAKLVTDPRQEPLEFDC